MILRFETDGSEEEKESSPSCFTEWRALLPPLSEVASDLTLLLSYAGLKLATSTDERTSCVLSGSRQEILHFLSVQSKED